MTVERSHQTVLETLEVLRELSVTGARPKEAQAALRALQERHPETRIDLIWQEELYDGSLQYDALLAFPTGTVSLSHCQESSLPWPLRGIHRWSDRELVRVDSNVVEMTDAIRFIDFGWDEQRVTDRLLSTCVIRLELDRNPVVVTREALQAAMDAFRQARRLYTAEETRAWLDRRGLTLASLESVLREQLEIAMLRTRLTSGDVGAHFDAHRGDFDVARFARIVVPEETTARRLVAGIREGSSSFLEAAESVYCASSSTIPSRGPSMPPEPPRPPPPGNVFVTLRRREARDALGQAVFGAAVGDVLGPVRVSEGYALARVLSREEARLDAGTREAIETILFEAWWKERLRTADVEWYWGKEQKAARRGRVSGSSPAPSSSSASRTADGPPGAAPGRL